jgi:hypothetical protein
MLFLSLKSMVSTCCRSRPLATEDTQKPSEKLIHDKLFHIVFPKTYPDSVIVKNWMGWSYRVSGNKKEQDKFRREFDIAVFQKQTFGSASNLVLTGFEIKGFSQKPPKPPAFLEGLDQAIALLGQGADYSYLVHPEPDKHEDKYAAKELCARFAPLIGLIFVPRDLQKVTYVSKYKEAGRNPHTIPDMKHKMLTALIAGGLRDDISPLPSWATQQQY